jgi:hypothetical protein
MLTGDHRGVAEAVAKQLGITRFLAEVLPSQKADEIRRLRDAGEHVGMVGDGVNDAPALASADVGLAMGSGTDVAVAAADVTLLGHRLDTVPTAIDLSRNAADDPAESVLGVRVQRGQHPRRRRRAVPVHRLVAVADAGQRRDGVFERVRRREQSAAATGVTVRIDLTGKRASIC